MHGQQHRKALQKCAKCQKTQLPETVKRQPEQDQPLLPSQALAPAAMSGAVRQTMAKDGLPEARLQLADTKHDKLQR
jgi:hypothetical protein